MHEPVNAKACTCCFQIKTPDQFYCCGGIWRLECKECVIKKNVKRQQILKPWRDKEKRREYQRQYYAKNKNKFAEYRKTFKERHPTYYKEYAAL